MVQKTFLERLKKDKVLEIFENENFAACVPHTQASKLANS